MAVKQNAYREMEVVHEGKRIVLPGPPDMSYREGIQWLERKQEEAEEVVAVDHVYNAFPLDGAAALYRAVKELHGWASVPAYQVAVPLPDGSSIQVPWGEFVIPGIDGKLSCGFVRNRQGLPNFRLAGKVRRKHRDKVLAIEDAISLELRQRSIYRGEAVQFTFPDAMEDFDPTIAPEFLDLRHYNPDELILNRDVEEMLDDTLFSPLRYTEQLRKHRIPLKRGILLHGPYGVGKTLLAFKAAKEATAQGWTYLLAQVQQLPQALDFALLYEPCVVFAEDLDHVVRRMGFEFIVNLLQNTIDGGRMKGREVIVVLTTNHLDVIQDHMPAMLRPGRLDTIQEIPPPDKDSVVKLVKLYSRTVLDGDVSDAQLEGLGVSLAGQFPAVIRETVERAKLRAVTQGRDSIDLSDLERSARTMLHHQKLLEPRKKDVRGELERAVSILARALVTGEEVPAVVTHQVPQQHTNGHDLAAD